MAISQLSPRKPSPYEPSTKLKQKALACKKKLLKKQPTGTKYLHIIKKHEIEEMNKPIICCKKSVDKTSEPSGCGKAESSSALDRANEVQANLPPKFPSFVKYMLKSHVSGGFWLGLPKRFCDKHLPEKDETVVLVDESQEEYETKYLGDKNGLSAGWRSFSIAHKLLEGDVLVFQLIKRCIFKVYIVRANGLAEIDGATGLLNLYFQAQSTVNALIKDENEDVKNFETARVDYMGPPTNNSHQDNAPEKGIVAVNSSHVPASYQSASENDDFSSEVLDGIRFSESVVEFKDVKGLEHFSILVDGLVIDSEIPRHLRTKYYNLCCNQNSFLHDHLVKGLNCKLAAGIISETVNIADAIRAAKLTTSCDHLQTWDKTLKAFEDMGMTVGFLRARIKKLVSLRCEQREIIKSKTNERVQVEEEIRNLETKLLNVKEVIKTLDAEIKVLKVKDEKLEQVFKETATAPW